MPVRLTRLIVATVALASGLSAAPPAGAHIQIQPTEVAPKDAALFTLLVPGESGTGTTKVELKVPPGVYPFSYEETPGWKRKLVKKPNGMVDRVVWTGHAVPDGLVRFTFLAGTPEKPGTIKWAAIQTYAGGQEARWIGEPDSENPAPFTEVSNTALPQNAGGESAPGGESAAPEVTASDEGTDWPLTAAALLGFFFGLSSLAILLVNRKNSARS
jgi:uncharacterized protein YcnI